MDKLSESQAKDIQRALDWVRSWYEGRYKRKDANGKPYLSGTEYALIQNRLDNLKVIISKYPLLTLYQDVLDSKLHFHKSLPADYELTEKEANALKELSKGMIGMYSPLLREPAVFLNPEELLDSNLHWVKNEGNTIHGSLAKAAVHEITHAATTGFTRQEDAVKHSIKSPSFQQSNEYYDLPVEVYARIAELRYNLNADPSHVFTIEEIRQFRNKAEKDHKQYTKDIKSVGKKKIQTLEQLPLDGKLLDHQLFSRYSDEEIMHLLNDTACRELQDLDREHQWNIMDERTMLTRIEVPKELVEPLPKRVAVHMRIKVG